MTITPSSPQTSPWIALDTARPYPEDWPIWICVAGESADEAVLLLDYVVGGIPKGYTHWCRSLAPTPPAKPLTQRKRDEQAFKTWEASDPHRTYSPAGCCRASPRAWHHGIAYERAAIRVLLSQAPSGHDRQSDMLCEVAKRVDSVVGGVS